MKPCDAGPDCVPAWLAPSTLSACGVLRGEELRGLKEILQAENMVICFQQLLGNKY